MRNPAALAVLPAALLSITPASAAPVVVNVGQLLSADAATSDDRFATSVGYLGDLDGDGHSEVVIGTRKDDDGGTDRGSVWIYFLDTDAAIAGMQKISDTQGYLSDPGSPGTKPGGLLDDSDGFGVGMAPLGDLDGDGIEDLAVGAGDEVGVARGAVWILFLNADGTVKDHQKISDTSGGLSGPGNPGGLLSDLDFFGASLAAIGDLDGDGVMDLAAGIGDDDGGLDRGAVLILFLNTDGTVKGQQKISDLAGDFGATLDDDDRFGWSVGGIGDLDGDGIEDLAVGSLNDDDALIEGDDAGPDRGAVYILFLDTDGTVQSYHKIVATFASDGDLFGSSLSSLGDLNGDGSRDLAVGAQADDGAGSDRGAVWVLELTSSGSVTSSHELDDALELTSLPASFALEDADQFGGAVAWIGDETGNGLGELVVGAPKDGAGNAGAAWVFFNHYKVTGTLEVDLPTRAWARRWPWRAPRPWASAAASTSPRWLSPGAS
jgi:hypothetical protein